VIHKWRGGKKEDVLIRTSPLIPLTEGEYIGEELKE